MSKSFSGTWKLVGNKGLKEFYAKTGMAQSEIDMLSQFDDPTKDLRFSMKVNGDDVEATTYFEGDVIHSEKFKIGETRDVQFENIKGTVTTTVKDGVWEDHFTRPGNADSYYRNTFDGDKMRVKCICQDVEAYRDFVKV